MKEVKPSKPNSKNHHLTKFLPTTIIVTIFWVCTQSFATNFALDELPTDESGYEVWLRYTPKPYLNELAENLTKVYIESKEVTSTAILAEWKLAMDGFFEKEIELLKEEKSTGISLIISNSIPEESYQISTKPSLKITGGSEKGLLYGTFSLLGKIQREEPYSSWAETSTPSIPLRMLNHWDNLTIDPTLGSIERVMGNTIFEWPDLQRPNPRYRDYARILASVGINGVTLNNVNSDPAILSSDLLKGVAALAEILRPYGIQVFITANFAAPVLLSGVPTADPLDPEVVKWWADKADEIYSLIPDFGGFLVKADSEGRPGPGYYGRSHVEGSKVMADALAPHGGIVIWRAFVYGRDISARTPHAKATNDVANHASYEFMHLDGEFPDNVILQVKCSVIDFQAWEPVHPLFGNMPKTRLGLEMDLAKQYKGYNSTLGWEGPYFSYILNHNMSSKENPQIVADIISGKHSNNGPGLITGVSNIHDAQDWFGHLLNASTLYTYGKKAWNPQADPLVILQEWARMTFGEKAALGVVKLLDDSYETQTKYMGLLGNHSLAELQHHIRPNPWDSLFAKKAGITHEGIGVDRSIETGTAFLQLYHPDVAAMYEDIETCPTRFLLFFHHLPWDHTMPDGRSLIQFLYDDYFEAVEEVRGYQDQWRDLFGTIDLARWSHVQDKLAQEAWHAEMWRDLMCRFLLETTEIPDLKKRFEKDMAFSPHVRVNSGFWRAVEDYRARVQREKKRLQKIMEKEKD